VRPKQADGADGRRVRRTPRGARRCSLIGLGSGPLAGDNRFMRTFTLEYWQDDGWYVGRLKEMAGVVSQGQTLAELEENIRDAYQLMTDAEPAPTAGPILTRQIEV